MIDLDDIRTRYQQACKFLDERGRRLFAANEALALGHGGVTATSAATGLARSTIRRAIVELQSGANPIGPRVRRKGGGRKRAVTLQPELPGALETLIEDAIRGDPETPLRWVSRSQRQIARVLGERGFAVSQKLVGLLLRELGYSCQANCKTREGTNHPDRDAQFAHINTVVQAAMAAGQPAISVDTKKKELVGDFKNPGRELRPKGQPEPVRVHDFELPDLGKVAPYGVYDLAANAGWVNVGVDADTAAFAVESIRRWWQQLGQSPLPRGQATGHHRRLRRQQRCPGAAVEARVAALRQRDRPGGHRGTPAAGDQQVEPHRAPPVCRHLAELARQTAGQPSGHRPADRRHDDADRPDGALRAGCEPLSQGHQGHRCRDGRARHRA